MPQRLPVPFYPQNSDGYCLAACAQMVFEYWGQVLDQERIADLLGVEPGVGVPAGRITRFHLHRFQTIYGIGDWDTIVANLDQEIPLITMIQAGELLHWQGELFQHAVVVIGYDDANVWLLDPAVPSSPIAVSMDEFMLAWGEMDYRYAVMKPERLA
jgi:ABC-type bacteriocin/lantibiotic exporter with double-glycine peptidase domain